MEKPETKLDKAPTPTQKTPKGYEIPIRPREDVIQAFRKVAQPQAPKDPKKG